MKISEFKKILKDFEVPDDSDMCLGLVCEDPKYELSNFQGCAVGKNWENNQKMVILYTHSAFAEQMSKLNPGKEVK